MTTADTDGASPAAVQPGGVWRPTRGGGSIHVRLLGDCDALRVFHSALTPESIQFRYFAPKPELSNDDLAWLTDVDVVQRCAFAAFGGDRIVAVGRWMREAETDNAAEVAFIVDDTLQGTRIGSMLLELLIELAPNSAISTFNASVLRANTPMLHVFDRCGHPIVRRCWDTVCHLTINLNATT